MAVSLEECEKLLESGLSQAGFQQLYQNVVIRRNRGF